MKVNNCSSQLLPCSLIWYPPRQYIGPSFILSLHKWHTRHYKTLSAVPLCWRYQMPKISIASTLDSQHLQEDLNLWSSNWSLLFGLSKSFCYNLKINSQQRIPLAPLQSHVLTPIKTLALLYQLTYYGMLTTSKWFLNRTKHSVY